MSHLRIKCTKFSFRWGGIPDPAGEDYSALTVPDSLAVFKGLTSSEGKGRIGNGRERKGKAKGDGRGGGWIWPTRKIWRDCVKTTMVGC